MKQWHYPHFAKENVLLLYYLLYSLGMSNWSCLPMELLIAHNNAAVADNPQCSVKSCEIMWRVLGSYCQTGNSIRILKIRVIWKPADIMKGETTLKYNHCKLHSRSAAFNDRSVFHLIWCSNSSTIIYPAYCVTSDWPCAVVDPLGYTDVLSSDIRLSDSTLSTVSRTSSPQI